MKPITANSIENFPAAVGVHQQCTVCTITLCEASSGLRVQMRQTHPCITRKACSQGQCVAGEEHPPAEK